MKNILAENMMRFGTKNLSDDIKRKLQEQTPPTPNPNVTSGAGSKLNQILGNVLNDKQVELLNQKPSVRGPLSPLNASTEKNIFDNYYRAQQSAVGKSLILNGISQSSKILGPIKAIFHGVDGAGNSRTFIWTTKIPIFNFSGLQKAYLAGVDPTGGLANDINKSGLNAGDIILSNIVDSKGLPPIQDEAPGIPMSAYFTTKPLGYDYVIFTDKVVNENGRNAFIVNNNKQQQEGTIPMQIILTSQTLDQTGIDVRTNPAETKQIQSLRTANPNKLNVDQKRAKEAIEKGIQR